MRKLLCAKGQQRLADFSAMEIHHLVAVATTIGALQSAQVLSLPSFFRSNTALFQGLDFCGTRFYACAHLFASLRQPSKLVPDPPASGISHMVQSWSVCIC